MSNGGFVYPRTDLGPIKAALVLITFRIKIYTLLPIFIGLQVKSIRS